MDSEDKADIYKVVDLINMVLPVELIKISHKLDLYDHIGQDRLCVAEVA